MSYIDEMITIEEFLSRCQNNSTKKLYATALSQFDYFCKDRFKKTGEQVLEDVAKDIKNNHNSNKLITVLNRFVQWCIKDHPEITFYHGRDNVIRRTIEAKNPNSIKKYIGKIRIVLEDVWNVEINPSKIKRCVKIPDAEEEQTEPFTKEQMRVFLDSLSSDKKTPFMVLKDTGMRIRELCQIRKRDIDISGKRIKISIQARYTKKKKARICYLTKETSRNFLTVYKNKKDNELLFTKNENPDAAKGGYQTIFTYYRSKVAETHPEFNERYQSNGMHKKTIHSIRSYTATQCTKAADESWGHAYIGHRKYLEQYIRDQDQFLDKFIRSESNLMVYETIEVVEQDSRVEKLEQEQAESKKKMIELLEVVNKLNNIKNDNLEKEQEIRHLQEIIASR